MRFTILATRNCAHRRLLEQQFADNDIPYQVRFFDDHPEDVDRLNLHASPNVLLDGGVVFRATGEHRLPTEAETADLRALLE